MPDRKKLKAMAKPNQGLPTPMFPVGLQDTRTFPERRAPNPTGEARIGPPTQGDLQHETFQDMSGLMSAGTTIGPGKVPLDPMGHNTDYLMKVLKSLGDDIGSLAETPYSQIAKASVEGLPNESPALIRQAADQRLSRYSNPGVSRKVEAAMAGVKEGNPDEAQGILEQIIQIFADLSHSGVDLLK